MSSYQIIDDGVIPDICIAMLTYNHEAYIAQAIDSILMQQVNYTYKIIIAEDGSTDRTRQIILDYQQKYPDRFKLILQNKNVGVARNNVDLLSNLEGRYVAALEGDDYWTDSLKLQKQVDFLEEHEDYILCSHYREVLQSGKLTKEESHIYTQCMLFRNVLGADFFEHFPHIFNGDTFLHKYLSLKGKTKILDFYGAVYRINDTGVYSSIDNAKRLKHGINTFNHLLQLKDNYRDDNARAVFKGIVAAQSTYYMSLIYLQTHEKQRKEAFRSYIEYTKFGLRNGLIGRANFWKNNLRYFYYLVKH